MKYVGYILSVFLIGFIFLNKPKTIVNTAKEDSLYKVIDSLFLKIESNKILIDSISDINEILTDSLQKKDKEIEDLNSDKDEKINIINNGSSMDSFNRLSERYSR